ncbi:MAG TPA: FdtA/QdtA family cupin domain-containing protein [Candidatus Gemmiger stercoravium]|nr:FdtA/QdtA family cupin domain-containing protein [Candidatus Gemmiger stercoravium]
MSKIDSAYFIEFAEHGDERGNLVVVEGERDVPFAIQRVFYIYGSDPDIVRGQHANRKSQFVLINVAGQSKIRVKDGLGNEAVFCLNRPRTGVYIPTMAWKEMYDFSPDSVLLCLASEHYDESEYIRDFAAFTAEVRTANQAATGGNR